MACPEHPLYRTEDPWQACSYLRLRREGVVLAHSLRSQSIMMGKAQKRERGAAAGRTASTVESTGLSAGSSSLSLFYSVRDSSPRDGTLHMQVLPTTIKLISAPTQTHPKVGLLGDSRPC